MFEYIYEWLRNLSYYLVLVTAVMHILPSSGYQRFLRFFTGMVFILMLITPVLELLSMDVDVAEIYEEYDFEKYKKEMEEIVIGQ